jgi:hypothetical protein
LDQVDRRGWMIKLNAEIVELVEAHPTDGARQRLDGCRAASRELGER